MSALINDGGPQIDERMRQKIIGFEAGAGPKPSRIYLGPDEYREFEAWGEKLKHQGLAVRDTSPSVKPAFMGVFVHRSSRPGIECRI